MLLNPFIGVNSVGSAGVTYFFDERFEGTGYQNTWSETGSTGTVDEDYTTSPLQGSQSLQLSATAQHPKTIATLPSDQSEIWGFFKLRIDTSLSATRRVITLLDSGGTEMVGVGIDSTNHAVTFAGNGGNPTTDAMTTGTDYNIWFHAKKGTGANGECSIGFSTGTTEVTAGNAFTGRTNGTNTADFHSIAAWLTTSGTANTTGAVVIDMILLSTTGTIGDNPS